MDPITLAALAFLGLGILGRGGRKSTPSFPSKLSRNEMANYVYQAGTHISKKYNTFPDLNLFFITIAWWESRFDHDAINPEGGPNAARGLFQLRPKSAFTKGNGLYGLLGKPNLLLNPNWAIVTAYDYARRGAQSAMRDGINPDMIAIKRWWRLPKNVDDVNFQNKDSKISLSAYKETLGKLGIPQSFMNKKVNIGKNPPSAATLAKEFNLL